MQWNRNRKVLASLLTVGLLGTVAAFGVFGAFSATTDNENNVFSTGTVNITDNDGDGFLYSVTNAIPGQSNPANEACIQVQYNGTIDGDVKLFTPTTTLAAGALSPFVTLEVTKGTQPTPVFKNCTGFTPTGAAGDVFNGTLQTFGTNHTSFTNGIVLTNPAGGPEWANGNAVVYRFRATLSASAPDSAQGKTTGLHAFRWEAQAD